MADSIQFAGLLLPILLGFIWTISPIHNGKRKLIHAGVAGTIGGAVICTADLLAAVPPPSCVALRAVMGGVVGAAAGLITLAIATVRKGKVKAADAGLVGAFAGAFLCIADPLYGVIARHDVAVRAATGGGVFGATAGLIIWAIAAVFRSKGNSLYVGVAGALPGALLCIGPIFVGDAIPLFFPLAFRAVVGAIVGASAGLALGLPAGLLYLRVRGNRWEQEKPLAVGTAGSPPSRAGPGHETASEKRRLNAALGPLDRSVLLVAGFVSVSTWLLLLYPRTYLPLPAIEDVVSIKAPVIAGHRKEMFEVPKACRADIYLALQPCNEDWPPADWAAMEHLKIENGDGSIYDVEVYETWDNVTAFNVTTREETRYFRLGDTNKFKAALAKAYSAFQKADGVPAKRQEHR